MYLPNGVLLNLADAAERRTLLESRLGFADHATRCGCRVPPGGRSDRPGRPAVRLEDFGMGTPVSSDCLAVAVQLPAQLRGPGLYSDHVVGGITAGLQRLRSLPHPVESDGDAALGARSQHNGRVDGYSWHRGSQPVDFRTPSSCCTTPPSPCSPWCSRPSGSASPGSRWSRSCTRRRAW